MPFWRKKEKKEAAKLPHGVVTAGYLYILSVGHLEFATHRNSWKRRYFVLTTDGVLTYFKKGKDGVGERAKGGCVLSADYFVGDSLFRKHGFQVSDFTITICSAYTHSTNSASTNNTTYNNANSTADANA